MSFTSNDTESDIDEGLLTLRRTLSTSDSKATDSRATESLELYQWRWLNDALMRRDWRATFRDIIPSIPPPPTDTVSPSTSSDDKSVTLCYSLSANFSTPASTRMPQELIDEILRLVGDEYRWNRQQYPIVSKSMCEAITSCSLVCLHWANLCRKRMFVNTGITIRSLQEAESFAGYAVHGCPSLTPVHRLISYVEVEQGYDAPFSFYRHMRPYLFLVNSNLQYYLRMIGPIPDEFPLEQLYAQHWGTTPASAPPVSTLLPYSFVAVKDVHLPSFACVVPYIRNFLPVESSSFTRLTWDGDDEDDPIIIAEGLDGLEAKPTHVHVRTFECTDNLALALQVAVNNPNSLVQILPGYEWQRILDLLLWVHEFLPTTREYQPRCSVDMMCPCDQSSGGKNMFYTIYLHMETWWNLSCSVYIVLQDHALPGSTTSNIRVVGFEMFYGENVGPWSDEYINHLSDVLEHLRGFPTLRAVSIRFSTLYAMYTVMGTQGSCLQNHPLGGVKICLTSGNDEGEVVSDEEDAGGEPADTDSAKIIGIDIKTLASNGQRWDRPSDVLLSLLYPL